MNLEVTLILENSESLVNGQEIMNNLGQDEIPIYNHNVDSSGNIIIPSDSESDLANEELPHFHFAGINDCVQQIAQTLNPNRTTLITVAALNNSMSEDKNDDPIQDQSKIKKQKNFELPTTSQYQELTLHLDPKSGENIQQKNVYSDIQKRWIHCDPSEAMFNKPLLYEVGWNKTLSYIIAIGDTGIQEVTWRYTTEKSRKKIKRDPHFDSLITQVTNDYQKQILENVTPAKKKYLLTRLVCELTELLAVMPSIEGSYEGRQSGSRDWRLQRGEVGKQVTYVRHIFKVDPVIQDTKRFAMWYSANSDAYIVSNYTGKDIVKYGWKNFVDSYKNIVRKEESDWKKSYLAREVNEETGVLKWRFMTDSKISFTGVYVLTNCFVCENGKVKCSIYSPGSNSSFQFENEVSKFWEGSVPPTKELYVEIQLSGGTGINAWQHAQFGRQSLHEGSTVSFGIIVYIQKD